MKLFFGESCDIFALRKFESMKKLKEKDVGEREGVRGEGGGGGGGGGEETMMKKKKEKE